MTTEEKIKALAELDGIKEGHWQFYASTGVEAVISGRIWAGYGYSRQDGNPINLPRYLTSYDAILPLIQKQGLHVLEPMAKILGCKHDYCAWMHLKPTQLADALLIATGRMTP